MNKFDFVGTLASIRPAATFLRLHHYRNELGEVADYNIVFHINYKNAIERSIAAIEAYQPENKLEAQAKSELLDGYQTSLKKVGVLENDDHYDHFYDDNGKVIKGVKLHKATDTIHLYGAVVNKKVVTAGKNKVTNKRPLTIAKDKLRSLTPLSAFRQFKITPSQVDKITVENLDLKIST
jgi:hypothetical protein